MVDTPAAPQAQPPLSPKVLHVASSGAGAASAWSRRGPNLRSGNAVLKFSVSPKSVTGTGGLYVSASIGGDPTISPSAGYTTAAGVVSPGKSYVFIWYYRNPPAAALYGGASVRTFQLGAPGSGSTCTVPFGALFSTSAWTTCTITLNSALSPPFPPADLPSDVNAFLDLQIGASGTSADGYFDKYTLDATSPVPAQTEFAYRNSVISTYDTPTFKIYPSVEIGVGNHTQRFNYATPDASQTAQQGTDAIAATQATGFPAQLNHPGVAGGVSDQE